MAAHAFVLHEPLGEREGARWGVSGAVIVALHVAVALLAMSWLKSQPEQGVSLPAIMVDMAPVTSAPQSMPDDVAPGPVMQEADASPPEPAQRQAVEETIAPTPPQDKPDVVAPPEQKLEPTPARPEPAKIGRLKSLCRRSRRSFAASQKSPRRRCPRRAPARRRAPSARRPWRPR